MAIYSTSLRSVATLTAPPFQNIFQRHRLQFTQALPDPVFSRTHHDRAAFAVWDWNHRALGHFLRPRFGRHAPQRPFAIRIISTTERTAAGSPTKKLNTATAVLMKRLNAARAARS